MFGSSGSVQRCRPKEVSSSISSSAPMVLRSSIAFLTESGSGGCSALAKKEATAPNCKLLIVRHSSCKGVLRISGN
uniref:Uncharacterized protein n=1 Tax=Arundo donax TaxID=35708 RepID=A0A0A9CQW7_ARUDO